MLSKGQEGNETMKPTKNKIKYSLQYRGEHHMGAASIDIVLEKPIKGVSRFYTTNGGAISSKDGRFVIVFCPLMFLVLDADDSSVYHCNTGTDYELPKFENENTIKIAHAPDIPLKTITIDLHSKKGLQKGFGRVSRGKFPGAYM